MNEIHIDNLLNYLIKQEKECDSCGSKAITQIHFNDRDESNWAFRNLVLFCDKCYFEYCNPELAEETKGGYISDTKSEMDIGLHKSRDTHGISGDFGEVIVDEVKFYTSQPEVKKNKYDEVVGIYDKIED